MHEVSKRQQIQKNQDIASIKESYEKRIFDLEQLLEISKSLNSTLDFNTLMDSIIFNCMGQMRVSKAGLFIKNVLNNDYLTLHRNQSGFEIDHSIEYTIPLNSEFLRLLSTDIKCYTMPELFEKIEDISSLKTFTILDPSLLIPLKSKESINGIIIIGERIDSAEFTDYEKDYLLNISYFASLAIHNAYLFEMATIDMMTKLKMRHFFDNVLKELFDEAMSVNKKLSLIMIDIDFFKKLNDTYGHICGDVVLKRITSIIRENIRQIDIAARYGGEEFTILLPESNVETAMSVGERIRLNIEKAEIEYGNKSLRATVSLGIAQLDPKRDHTCEAFIDRADRALYSSKQTGRNKITVDK